MSAINKLFEDYEAVINEIKLAAQTVSPGNASLNSNHEQAQKLLDLARVEHKILLTLVKELDKMEGRTP